MRLTTAITRILRATQLDEDQASQRLLGLARNSIRSSFVSCQHCGRLHHTRDDLCSSESSIFKEAITTKFDCDKDETTRSHDFSMKRAAKRPKIDRNTHVQCPSNFLKNQQKTKFSISLISATTLLRSEHSEPCACRQRMEELSPQDCSMLNYLPGTDVTVLGQMVGVPKVRPD